MEASSSISSFEMHQRALHLLTFLLTVYVLDKGIGTLLGSLHRQCKHGTIGLRNEVFLSIQPDILIIGSSRAAHHFISELIEEKLNRACFNAGAAGSEIEYHAAVYYANVERSEPKLVILDISSYRFTLEGGNEGKLRVLAPYLGQFEQVDRIFYASDPWSRLKTLSTVYRYNSELTDLLIGGGLATHSKGYSALLGQMDPSTALVEDRTMPATTPDDRKLAILEGMLQDAKRRKIPILLVQSPRFSIAVENSVTRRIASLAQKYETKFFNDDNLHGIFDQPQYFQDTTHLNHRGAEEYTRVIIDRLLASTISSRREFDISCNLTSASMHETEKQLERASDSLCTNH